jgi:hypothetical protein
MRDTLLQGSATGHVAYLSCFAGLLYAALSAYSGQGERSAAEALLSIERSWPDIAAVSGWSPA